MQLQELPIVFFVKIASKERNKTNPPIVSLMQIRKYSGKARILLFQYFVPIFCHSSFYTSNANQNITKQSYISHMRYYNFSIPSSSRCTSAKISPADPSSTKSNE